MAMCLKLYTKKYQIIIIILGQHKDTFEKKIFKVIYTLHFLLKLSTPIFVGVSEQKTFCTHDNCSLIFQPKNTKWHPQRDHFLSGNIQDNVHNFDVN